jgi:hypothetical protein
MSSARDVTHWPGSQTNVEEHSESSTVYGPDTGKASLNIPRENTGGTKCILATFTFRTTGVDWAHRNPDVTQYRDKWAWSGLGTLRTEDSHSVPGQVSVEWTGHAQNCG